VKNERNETCAWIESLAADLVADGLSGFLEASLAPVMTSVITFSMLEGTHRGRVDCSIRDEVRSMPWDCLWEWSIAALLVCCCAHAEWRFSGTSMLPDGDRSDRGFRDAKVRTKNRVEARDAIVWS